MKEEDLAADDGDRGEGIPERRESVIAATVVAEGSTSSLNPIHQTDQTLHCCHQIFYLIEKQIFSSEKNKINLKESNNFLAWEI